MTEEKHRARPRLPTPGQAMFIFMCGFSLILILRNSDAAIEYMGNGLILCVRTVIPALFPFMVISELIVSSGLGDFIGKCLNRPIGWLFGISGVSACAVIMGTFCGFPIGARTAVALLDQGLIEKKEASRLITFCNNPSSAFIISAVGASLYSSRNIGLMLYVVTLINAFIIGVAQRLFLPKIDIKNDHKIKTYPSGITAFTDAVTHSAYGMLIVCAYVVFFSAIMGCLSNLLSALYCSQPIKTFIYGIVELSGGVSASSSLGLNIFGLCLTAFTVGWSGLSVHFQIISVCSGKGLSFRGYFIAKLVQGLMNSLVVFLLCRIFPDILLYNAPDAASPTITNAVSDPYITAVLLTFAAALPFSFRKAALMRHT